MVLSHISLGEVKILNRAHSSIQSTRLDAILKADSGV